jgi:glycosyltransferase involved in cell wall biosynthesis
MKPVFVSFQGFSPEGRPWGMVRIMEPVVDSIVDSTYYIVSSAPKKYKYFRGFSRSNKLILKLIWAIGVRIKINVGILRYLQEVWFDFVSSKDISYPCLLVSTAYIPTAAKKNADAGGFNLFIAGNPYDGYINQILQNEKKKHGIELNDAYTYRPRIKFIESFISLQNEIISQSIVTHESFVINFPKIAAKCIPYEIVPNGMYFPDMAIKKRKTFTFIYAASTVWLKGLTYLIDAWLLVDVKDSTLVIVGSIYPDVARFIRGKKSKSIEVVGFVPTQALNELYRESHVCIVPSLVDNHPATIAEAMHCGLPVIATDGCGSKGLITEGKTGFVVPIGDVIALAQKIEWFSENRALTPRMGHEARAAVDSLDQTGQVRQFAEAIISRRNLKI